METSVQLCCEEKGYRRLGATGLLPLLGLRSSFVSWKVSEYVSGFESVCCGQLLHCAPRVSVLRAVASVISRAAGRVGQNLLLQQFRRRRAGCKQINKQRNINKRCMTDIF